MAVVSKVRHDNLVTIVDLIHRRGSASRSALTRATGLNRSTISALVAELALLGLVQEREPDAGGRVGRPSPVVSAADSIVAVAVNPEIDAVTVGLVGLNGRMRSRIRHPTDHVPNPQEVVSIVVAAIDTMRTEFGPTLVIVGIGAAVPGLVRASDGVVRLAPHLNWVDEPFATVLHDATGLPAFAANDASLGVSAERLFGAGRGVDDLVYLNGGASGVGGGVISGGAALSGAAGYAGELGHTLVNSAGSRCHCGAIGCLETEVAQASLLRALGLASADLDELDAALAASGDPLVAAEVERQLGFLAITLRNATNVFNPELIVLGGFLASLFAAHPERLEQLVAERSLPVSGEGVRIVRAELGSRLLMIGAAELAFQPLLNDPTGYPN
jgi:predicted NBD/HSP70 family sugar kinase